MYLLILRADHTIHDFSAELYWHVFMFNRACHTNKFVCFSMSNCEGLFHPLNNVRPKTETKVRHPSAWFAVLELTVQFLVLIFPLFCLRLVFVCLFRLWNLYLLNHLSILWSIRSSCPSWQITPILLWFYVNIQPEVFIWCKNRKVRIIIAFMCLYRSCPRHLTFHTPYSDLLICQHGWHRCCQCAGLLTKLLVSDSGFQFFKCILMNRHMYENTCKYPLSILFFKGGPLPQQKRA